MFCSDGQKMSKSKKNFPDPLEVVNKYGADALRSALLEINCVVFSRLVVSHMKKAEILMFES